MLQLIILNLVHTESSVEAKYEYLFIVMYFTKSIVTIYFFVNRNFIPFS